MSIVHYKHFFHLSKQLPVPFIICIWINLSWLLEIIRTNPIPLHLTGPQNLHNLNKFRSLYSLPHRWSDNSHYWSCSSELCMNFVVCILRHDFDESDSVIQTQCSIFEDNNSYVFVSPRTSSLLRFKRSKGKIFRNSFRQMRDAKA